MKAFIVWVIRKTLNFYLWLYDEHTGHERNSYLHKKIIWELKRVISDLR